MEIEVSYVTIFAHCLTVIGLGLGLVRHYLALPNNVVVVGVRNPAHPTVKKLSTLSKNTSSSLVVVHIESASKSSALAAVDRLQTEYDVQRLDIVIANAGIATAWPTVADASAEDSMYKPRPGPTIRREPSSLTLGDPLGSHTKFLQCRSIIVST